jgi:hypothetical protein
MRHHVVLTAVASAAVLVVAAAYSAAMSTAESSAGSVPASAVTTDASSVPRPRVRPLAGTGIIRWGSTYRTAAGYERYAYVLVGMPDAQRAARLPGTSLVYMSGTSVPRQWSTGVSYHEALGNGWLLKDAGGSYVMNVTYGRYVGDVGDPAYQRRFVNNVTEFLQRTRLDGVFIDDVLGFPLGLTGGVYPAKYPTPESWENAMVAFVSAVGKTLKARGFYVLANASKFVPGDPRSNTSENAAAFWRRIAPSVSGLMLEYWLQSPIDVAQLRAEGSRWYELWPSWQSLVSVAQGAGVDFFGLMYGAGADVRAMRYVRGSFLLDWTGRGGAVIFSPTDRSDPYHAAWMKQLGTAMKPKRLLAPGIWQRQYRRGIVVVNTRKEAATVTVRGRAWTIGPTDALFAHCACARRG